MMSCEDLDRLRTAFPGSTSSDWPQEARHHLASCEHCSQLQAALDLSSQVDYSDALQGRIEAAIIPGLRPVLHAPSVLQATLTLLLGSIGVIAVANWRLGTAGWNARSGLQAFVDFSLLGTSLLVFANTLAHQMVPGFRRKAPPLFYFAAPLLAFCAVDFAIFGYRWNPDFVPIAFRCWEIGVICAALSAPLFWLVLRRGFSLNPVAQGGIAGVLAGLTGMMVLEIYCPYLDRLHISAAHIGAAVTSALVGAAWGGMKGRIQRRVS